MQGKQEFTTCSAENFRNHYAENAFFFVGNGGNEVKRNDIDTLPKKLS